MKNIWINHVVVKIPYSKYIEGEEWMRLYHSLFYLA